MKILEQIDKYLNEAKVYRYQGENFLFTTTYSKTKANDIVASLDGAPKSWVRDRWTSPSEDNKDSQFAIKNPGKIVVFGKKKGHWDWDDSKPIAILDPVKELKKADGDTFKIKSLRARGK